MEIRSALYLSSPSVCTVGEDDDESAVCGGGDLITARGSSGEIGRLRSQVQN